MSEQSEKMADEAAVCDVCGRYGAQEIGDRSLCADCVTLAGSACAGSAETEA